MARNGAVYMVAIGGAGAAKAASIKNVEVIAYDELGCESVKRLTVENFSAIVSQDWSAATSTPRALQSIRRIEPKADGCPPFSFTCARQKLGGRSEEFSL